MPELISQSEVVLEFADLASWTQRKVPKTARRRSPGIHLSGIIRAVMQKLGKLEPGDLADEMPTVMAVGMAWENWYVGLADLAEVRWQPGEWEKDGVFGTPDGQTEHVLEEFKYTLKSQAKYGDVLHEAIWMWQLAGNCAALGLRRARLHVCWGCGDYRPPKPKLMRYVVSFGEAELEKFWTNVVLGNKGLAVPEEGSR